MSVELSNSALLKLAAWLLGANFTLLGIIYVDLKGDMDQNNQAWPRIERQQISDGKDIDELKRRVSTLEQDRSFNTNGGFPGRKSRHGDKDGIPRGPVEAPKPAPAPISPGPRPRDQGPEPADDDVILEIKR